MLRSESKNKNCNCIIRLETRRKIQEDSRDTGAVKKPRTAEGNQNARNTKSLVSTKVLQRGKVGVSTSSEYAKCGLNIRPFANVFHAGTVIITNGSKSINRCGKYRHQVIHVAPSSLVHGDGCDMLNSREYCLCSKKLKNKKNTTSIII